MKIQLKTQATDGAGGGSDRPEITQESTFEVKILGVEHRETRWDATDKDGNKLLNEEGNTYKNKEFNFRFGIEDEGPHNGRWVWGSTSDWFSTSSRCKLANWIKAILDEPVLPEGFTIDPEEDLTDLRCRVVVQAKKRDDGTYSNWVSDVFPTKAGASSTQQRVQEHLGASSSDDDLEPF
jgi:hypothetical protein